MQNKKTDITKPIGIFLGALLLTLGFCSQADAGQENNKCKNNGVNMLCNDASIEHKKWAKEYHSNFKNDKERFLHNHIMWLNDNDIKIKPKLIKINGLKTRNSMKSYIGKGEMGEVINSDEAQFGNKFWTVTADYSKCAKPDYWSDCLSTGGSSRKEVRHDGWTIKEGDTKWFHYSFRPVNNVLFDNDYTRVTVGQCHPNDEGGHKGLNWMIVLRDGDLYIKQDFKWGSKNYYMDVDNNYWRDGKYGSHTLIKELDVNEQGGTDEWINIVIMQKQTKNPDGALQVWVDGELKYSYTGRMVHPVVIRDNKKQTSQCYLKMGVYANGLTYETNPTNIENMTVWLDGITVANSKEELYKKLLKDK